MTNIDEILAARDHDLNEFSSDGAEDRFARAAVIRMTNSLLPREHQIHRPRLTVKIDPPWNVDIGVIGQLAHAVQQATGMLTEARERKLDVTSARKARSAAPIQLLPSSGSTLVFNLDPSRDVTRAEHGMYTAASLAGATFVELAANDLCESLPPVDDARMSDLSGLLAASPTMRAAVKRIVSAPITGVSTTLTLANHHGETTAAKLAPDQVTYLRKELKVDAVREVHIVERDGYLDGSRGRRRIFYLDISDTRSIEGSIDEELVDQVRAAEGHNVRVRLEVSTAEGHRDLYRLIGIVPQLGDA